MESNAKKYIVITGASSGIGYESAKAFAAKGKHLFLVARRRTNLETLKQDILAEFPEIDIVVKARDLSIRENVYLVYNEISEYSLIAWINNAGFGNYDTVAHQDLDKVEAMLHLNIDALTMLSTLFVRDYQNIEGAQLINISSAGGYTIVPNAINTIVPNAITYCAQSSM